MNYVRTKLLGWVNLEQYERIVVNQTYVDGGFGVYVMKDNIPYMIDEFDTEKEAYDMIASLFVIEEELVI